MRNKLAVLLFAMLILGLSFTAMPKKANATPSFAQKYHFSCAVCHTVFPNLNPFGRAFWRNGFRLPGTNGTPADATQIAEGLSLPNPWPIPLMVGITIDYQHVTNENVNPSTDAFSIAAAPIVASGVFKLYTPFANSLSYYVHFELGKGPGTPALALGLDQAVASLNGLGSGFGIAPHLFNLKMGQVTTATPYFYRQNQFGYNIVGLATAGQNLNVGYDGEGGSLIHARNPGFALYGTPGYHLWYKVTVTNDAGSEVGEAAPVAQVSNAMEYSYELHEYDPIPMGQLEFGYFGATIAEPISIAGDGTNAWTNRVTVNGIDVDIANDVYELGATYMVQSDSNPYANNTSFKGTLANGTSVSGTSNGYSAFEVSGRYLFPTMLGSGVMLSADYAQYSWTHKDLQEAFNPVTAGCPNDSGLYGGSTYNVNSCGNSGIKDALVLQAEINLAYNAHLFVDYQFTNQSENNGFDAGLDMAF